MDTRMLEYFLAVAQEGSITHAARVLHVTQPTLTRQLQQLERDLGCALLVRGNRNVSLTPEGALFRRRAQEICDLAERAREELAFDGRELSGTVAVGCGEMRAMEELADLMAGFQEAHPLVKFHLHSSGNEDIVERMGAGLLDVGLLLEPVDTGRYDFVRMRTRERWGALVHEECPLARLSAIRPGDMVGTPVVTVQVNTPVHRQLGEWSGKYARDMEFCVTYNALYDAVVVARRRKGAVVCLDLGCEYEGMKFVPFDPPLEMASVLAWRGGVARSDAVAAFCEFAQERFWLAGESDRARPSEVGPDGREASESGLDAAGSLVL